MKESCSDTVTSPPRVQRIERLQTIEKEHKDALERAVSLKVPHAISFNKESFEDAKAEEEEEEEEEEDDPNEESSNTQPKSNGGKANWDELIEKLFTKPDSEELNLKRVEDAQGSQNS